MKKTVLLTLTCFVLLAANVHAASVYLKDGTILRGTVTEEDDRTILLETNDKWQKIDKSTIEFIRKDDRKQVESSVTGTVDAAKPSAALAGKRAVSGNWETILKIGGDVLGRHSFSNVKTAGTNSIDRRDSTIGTGISLTAEEIYYLRPTIGVGGGISFQTTRREPDTDGHFSFVPVYGLLRVRSTPSDDNHYAFATAQFGYNYFIADSTYAGAGNFAMTNGIYAGLGGGYVFGRMQVEALYTVDRGRFSGHDYDAANAAYAVSANTTYSKISLSVGVLF